MQIYYAHAAIPEFIHGGASGWRLRVEQEKVFGAISAFVWRWVWRLFVSAYFWRPITAGVWGNRIDTTEVSHLWAPNGRLLRLSRAIQRDKVV